MDAEGCVGAFIGFCIFLIVVLIGIEQLWG